MLSLQGVYDKLQECTKNFNTVLPREGGGGRKDQGICTFKERKKHSLLSKTYLHFKEGYFIIVKLTNIHLCHLELLKWHFFPPS